MQNTQLLLIKNSAYSARSQIHIRNGIVEFRYPYQSLDLTGIKAILRFISDVRKRFRNIKVPIHINMGEITAENKLSITLLECILYALIIELKYPVTADFLMHHTVFTESIKYSPLLKLQGFGKKYIEEFKCAFNKDTKLEHLRLVIPRQADGAGILSIETGNIRHFLEHALIDKKFSCELAGVIGELVGNANEHNQSSCLVDIDISREYVKEDTESFYKKINVSLVSLSEQPFGMSLRNKIENEDDLGERYDYIKKAVENHSELFDNEYNIDDFFRIVAFQDQISERMDNRVTGGTGLTKLLKSLVTPANEGECYFLTENRIVHFDRSLLDYDAMGWIGFNEQRDFANYPPAKHILESSPFRMPGIAYNLSFAYKKEGIDDEGYTASI